jgi:hypothetical protein
MAFSYFTESRLVPIYESNPKTTASPATVNLNPQTEVETVTDQDSYNLVADPYVQVQVTAGVPNGAQPAWWPDGWVLRKFLRKCLKRNAPSSVTGESFTGVSFGDYKFTSDVASKTGSARFVKKQEIAHKPEKGPPVYKPGYVCAACGRLSADHRLYETTSLKALAQSLVNAHIVAGRDRPPMFGLLDVRESNGTNRQMVVAESGFNYRFEPTIQAQAALFLGVAHHYVTLTDITAMNDTYKDCNGGTVTAQGKKFTCAAPKLVQYYAHNLRTTYAAPVIYMTEIAVASQGIYVEGHTSESCDTCRNTIPKMLCTLTNLERQADGGRYPRRERS